MNYTPIHQSLYPSKKSINILPLIFILIFLFLGLVTGVFFFYIQPKLAIVNESKKTLTYIPEIRESVNNVGDSLKKMYELITGQTNKQNTTKTLLRLNLNNFITQVKELNKQEGEVAGAETSAKTVSSHLYNFFNNINTLYTIIADSGDFGIKKRKVLGENNTNLESQRTNLLRQIKTLAETGSNSSKEADEKLENLSAYLVNAGTQYEELTNINRKINDNNQKVSKYLDQAEKTTSYYYKISDFQIKLNPFLTSYYSLISEVSQSNSPELFSNRIDELKSTINKLNLEINRVSKNDLPQGLEELHSDNLKIVAILNKNVNDVDQVLKTKVYADFLKTIFSLAQELEPLATRALSLELNFWQNNSSLKNYEDLVTGYKNQEKALQDIINKNKLPLITS